MSNVFSPVVFEILLCLCGCLVHVYMCAALNFEFQSALLKTFQSSQVLELLWNLAHRDDCPTDTMDHALNAHIKILDYSCSQVG